MSEELIGIDNDKDGSGMRGEDIYNGKKEELMLASFSELYSKLDIISVDASDTFLVYLTLSTDYYLLLLTTALMKLYMILS